MEDNELRKILEEVGVEPDKIDEALTLLSDKTVVKKISGTGPSEDLPDIGEILYLEMQSETDWRRRAALAARIISLKIDV